MGVPLMDSMWYNLKDIDLTEAGDRSTVVHNNHKSASGHPRWMDTGGALFIGQLNKALKVLFVDCFCPPHQGTAAARDGKVPIRDFTLKAVMMAGRVEHDMELGISGTPACIYFGIGQEDFRVGPFIVQKMVGKHDSGVSGTQLHIHFSRRFQLPSKRSPLI